LLVRRILKIGTVVMVLAVIAGCATGRAVRSGQRAARSGDWDTAVVYYRQALAREPNRADIKIALGRAMQEAAAAHLKRARELEAQDQLPGAAAEYRLASDLDPSNAIALTKAMQLERNIRDQIEASRPKPRIDALKEQAAQAGSILRLDPRVRVPLLKFGGTAIRDILQTIQDITGINITYDQNIPNINSPYSVNLTDASVEEALNQILKANALVFKVLNQRSIFIYADTATNRQKYEDVYFVPFYISNGDPQEIFGILSQVVMQGVVVRPVIQPNKTARTINVRATAPVLEIIGKIIAMNDKPMAEVMVDVEILEVSRSKAKQLGVDLANFAINLNYSPEVTPSSSTSPQFNLNTLSSGFRPSDFYLTVPTANIRLLEQDQKTRILAKTQLQGREGVALTLNLGDEIPFATATYNAAGGLQGNILPSSIQFKPVGVNLSMTPRVTYQDEIILDGLIIDKSGLGPFFDVQGQSQPSFVRRTVNVTMRLRDGESRLLAGLLRDEDTSTTRSIPGLGRIPVLKNIFGWVDSKRDQSDVVIIVTPHIIRGHELTQDDFKPLWVGTSVDIGGGTPPQLIAPNAGGGPPETMPLTGALPPSTGVAPPPVPPGTGAAAPPTTPTGGGAPRPVGVVPVVPVVPVTGAGTPPAGQPQFAIGIGSTEFTTTGGPYAVPIQATNVSNLAATSLTIEYNPAVLRATVVNPGTFMQQGGARPTFVPNIDNTKGRIDIAISTNGAGVSGSGPLAAIMFEAVAPGTSQISMTGTAATPSGVLQVQMVPANVTVRRDQ
jgi:general secretion pathway protein D